MPAGARLGGAAIIGHSNGGNVALVTLLEHPEVVQTCIPQAANAYVTPYLIDREPAVFDPERVACEDPEWMNEMIALHGPTHGVNYWRDLLQMTLREIVAEPNYTPADLAQVRRPVFVIQGANDVVNAADRHAQFIAQHIPNAELWIPDGVAHNVHLEVPLDWLTRVLDFLQRRGNEANDALYRLHRARYADTRETIFDVQCSPLLLGQATGYTGASRKQMDCTELNTCWRTDHKIPSGSNYERCRSVHAEMNALLQAGKNARGCTLYLAGFDVATDDLNRYGPVSSARR